jgi:hypothetical protein
MRYLGEKEIENLKWQYLKLSELYWEYCEWKRKKAIKPRLTLPKKFKPATGPMQDINPIVMVYLKYGDIHAKSFEDWYVQYYKGDGAGEGTLLGSVEDLSGADPSMKYFMRNMFHYITVEAKRTLGREPSLLEMADLLCITMRLESHFQSYLKINQADFSKAEVERLVKKVRQILMKKVPSKRFVKNELERYLRVYTMRTCSPKVTYKDICEKEFPRDNASEENRRRALITDFNNAKKIIHNIEKDIQIWWSPESDK